MQSNNNSPRIAIYTHDTFGLGHVRRCMHIIQCLAKRAPKSALLFITGSPVSQIMKDLPPNADFIKIPTVVKTGTKRSQPAHLPLPLAEVQMFRENMILEVLKNFTPDVLLVDNFPLGSQRELMRALHLARRMSVRTILGLRDILDAPEVVQADWQRQGMYELIERYYEKLLVYGMQEIFDIAEAYRMPSGLAEKITYCGYVARNENLARNPEEVRKEWKVKGGPLLLATGGGWR